MKTKFEMKVLNGNEDFTPLVFELDGEISKERWETFCTILPMFLEEASKKDSSKPTLTADVEVEKAV